MPQLWVIGGPNGAGKTTVGKRELALMRAAKAAGYKVNLIFIGVPKPIFAWRESCSGWQTVGTRFRRTMFAAAMQEAWPISEKASP